MKIWKKNGVTSVVGSFSVYSVGDKLGGGAFGTVHLGKNEITDEKIAIKIINTPNLEQAEIEIMRCLNFRFCLSCIDYWVDKEFSYVIMEYCGGGDLFDALENGLIDEPRAKQAVKCTLIGLEYLHANSICHRDIKPENIMCTVNPTEKSSKNQIWKIIDFGLSINFTEKEPIMHGNVGTAQYKAPEVYPPSRYTTAIDLWSTGVTIYVALTGKFLWSGSNDEEVQESVLEHNVEYEQDFSFEAYNFIDSLLAPNPDSRLTIQQALEHPWLKT